MYLFIIGIVFAIVGGIMNIRGNTSRFNPPSGGGSRIPPEAQVRLNESVQRVSGVKETYDQYFHGSNVFKPNIPGLITLLLGVAFIAISYFLHI